jgi:hypothetical protein
LPADAAFFSVPFWRCEFAPPFELTVYLYPLVFNAAGDTPSGGKVDSRQYGIIAV